MKLPTALEFLEGAQQALEIEPPDFYFLPVGCHVCSHKACWAVCDACSKLKIAMINRWRKMEGLE